MFVLTPSFEEKSASSDDICGWLSVVVRTGSESLENESTSYRTCSGKILFTRSDMFHFRLDRREFIPTVLACIYILGLSRYPLPK